jgi:SAM-dependent methyltransferase
MTAMRFGLLRMVLVCTLGLAGVSAQAQEPPPFEPQVGQAGKDVVWVPTPEALVEKMLDMAQVTSQDIVMDLGSGDGRNVIGAARRGARAIGIEYNPDMVALSRRNAEQAGVSDKASFIQGDMYTADVSQATALVLFLLSTNLEKLTPTFLNLKPGTRIVDNTFTIPGWTPDRTETLDSDCTTWCTALLWIVPARVKGTWKLTEGELVLDQAFQTVTGTLKMGGQSMAIENGRLAGEQLTFKAAGSEYVARVSGRAMEGTRKSAGVESPWTAAQVR